MAIVATALAWITVFATLRSRGLSVAGAVAFLSASVGAVGVAVVAGARSAFGVVAVAVVVAAFASAGVVLRTASTTSVHR
jgi:hypothetical protein